MRALAGGIIFFFPGDKVIAGVLKMLFKSPTLFVNIVWRRASFSLIFSLTAANK